MATQLPPDLVIPIGTSLVPGGIESTFGMVFIAIIVSAVLFGILMVQMYLYYNNFPQDPIWIKGVVALVCALDLAQMATTIAFAWWYLVRNWGNLTAITFSEPTYPLFVYFTAIVVVIVELTMLCRLYAFAPKQWYFTLPIFVFIMVQFAFGLYIPHYGFKVVPFTEVVTSGAVPEARVCVWLGTSLAADLCITILLCINLHGSRSGLTQSDNIINKIIFYTMNTCALTAVTALCNIILFLAMNNNMVHLLFNIILSKVFSNSLIASLNTRVLLRKGTGTRVEVSVLTQKSTHVDTHGYRSEIKSSGAHSIHPMPRHGSDENFGSSQSGATIFV